VNAEDDSKLLLCWTKLRETSSVYIFFLPTGQVALASFAPPCIFKLCLRVRTLDVGDVFEGCAGLQLQELRPGQVQARLTC